MAAERSIRIVTTVHRADDPRISYREGRTLAAEFGDVTLYAPERGSGSIPVGLSYVPFPAEDGRAKRVLGALLLGLRSGRSVFHLHDPELFLLAPILRARGHQVVLDLHEDYPRQVYTKPYIDDRAKPLVSKVVRQLLRVLCSTSSAIVVADDFVAENLGLEDAVTVKNYTALSELPSSLTPYQDRGSVVVSIGSISLERCFSEMLSAAGVLADSEVHIAGAVPAPLADSHSVSNNVTLPGWLDRQNAMHLIGQARVGWALLWDLPQYRLAMPTKVFEYMLSGIPVVVSDSGILGEKVSDIGCGIAVDSRDPSAIAAATRTLLSDPALAGEMASRGRQYAVENCEWTTEGESLVAMYRALRSTD